MSAASIICPVLIGRTPHLDILVQLIEQASGGSGQTVLIAGEAGIGKSRLLAEAIACLLSPPAQSPSPAPLILRGRCFESDTVFPYAPLLDLLRSFFTSHSPDATIACLGSIAPELGKLLPELAALLPKLEPNPALEPEQEKRRLYQALTHFFTCLSAQQPLLIIVEDVHWSDDTSLEFLLSLARRIASHRVLLLLTYRSEEVQPALTRFLAGLDRERLATELTLTRLKIGEVDAMIRAIYDLPRSVRADFLEAIYRLTEGNPFFIEEVLKSLIIEGEIVYADGVLALHGKPLRELRLPRSVLVAVQGRLDHLSPGARDLLSLAAVAGQRFDFVLLRQLTQCDETELVRLVKELIAAQLVGEETDDVFAFRHALTRQAVYSDLLARERRALHRSIAEALERVYADTQEMHLGDLASHFYAAGVWDKALEYAQRAGEKAQRLYAPRAALEHFTHALEAAQHLALPPRPPLYRACGQVSEVLGEFEAARADYTRALELAREAHDHGMEWQSLFDLGFLWTGRDYTQAGDYLHRALERARAMDDPSIFAQSLNRLGNWHMNVEEPLEGQRYHREALALFEALADQHGKAMTLDLLSVASGMSGDLFASMEYHEQALALFRALDDRPRLVSCLATRSMIGGNYLSDTIAWPTGSGVEYIQEGEEALALARQLDWRSGEAYTLICLTCGLGPRGDYRQALAYAQAALTLATEIEHDMWMMIAHLLLGILALDLLALPTAQQHLESAVPLAKNSGSLFWLRAVTSSLALVRIAQHNFDRGETVLSTVFSSGMPSQTLAQRLTWGARAELELAREHPEEAVHIVDRLLASTAHLEHGVIPRLWHLRGRACLSLGQLAEAESLLLAAQATAYAQGISPMLWRISVTLGQLYRAAARREEAEEAFASAHTVIKDLANNVPDEALRENFLRCTTASIPSPRPRSPRQVAKQAFEGLTEREREVARLVAQGKSNRALADALFVSERTAAKHVERIMTKLGCTSRAQIAAWAVEKGLAKHIG